MYIPIDKKPVMKVKHLHKIPEKKKVWPVMGDEKIDGVYCYCIVRNGDWRIFSMTGKQYFSMRHLTNEACKLHRQDRYRGTEFVIIFEAHIKCQPINIISGKCRSHSNHPELYGIVHDCIPYQDFILKDCRIPYTVRRDNAARFALCSDLFVEHRSFPLFNEQEVEQRFAEIVADGGEGLIGRNPMGYWIGGHRRNADCWKKKIEESFDLLVTGVVQGANDGKYCNTLGTLAARFRRFGVPAGELVTITFSGMTDAQRGAWWEEPSRIIGKIVKVDAMTFTKDGLLREPRFKEVRMDKDEADF